MFSFKDCQEIINERLEAIKFPENPENLYEPIRYVINLGGKRIRPALVLMACNMFSDSVENAINPAIAIELLHNFTLLHDDIMDQSDLRRNKPTVHKKWNYNIAILSGDAMMIKAYEFLFNSNPYQLNDILLLFNKTALEICEGQQYDMDFESKSVVAVKDYLKMIELKTAVLLAASLKIGAICGMSSSDDTDLLYSFGKNLGIAFQLQDDLLDVYGSTELLGKQTGNDIAANKKTFLLLTALNLAQGERLNQLKYWLNIGKTEKDKKIKNIKTIFDELRIKEKTENEIAKYFNIAMQSLENVKCDKKRKIPLYHFTEELMQRKK
jgi:geranylgeranyl diphosphate synthase type II